MRVDEFERIRKEARGKKQHQQMPVAWASMLANALRQLVDLKDYKEEFGKTDEYKHRQVQAWDQARRALEITRE